MTGSLTGLELFHKKFDLPLDRILHTESPYFYRRENLDMGEEDFANYCAQCLERLIEEQGADTIAAFIAEPILGTGGIVPPPKNYWNVIIFYALMAILNFITALNWPHDSQYDLIRFPPDNLGPGIIKLHIFVIPVGIFLILSIMISLDGLHALPIKSAPYTC